MNQPSRRTFVVGTAAMAALAHPLATAAQTGAQSKAMQEVLEYVRGQKTTGFLIIQNRQTLVEKNWPLDADAGKFRDDFTYGQAADGSLLEDVASQQKSFVSFLAATAVDKGLLDVNSPVSTYLGAGWSKASPAQEAQIQVIHVLTMSTGLGTGFGYTAPPGTSFLYNTPVYATTKRIVAAAAKSTIETVTHDWLTAPAGMNDTAWRKRPAVFADVGNPTGLVTTPRDTAKLGQIVLDGGKAMDGTRIVSETGLKAMFARSPANPSYGRLWWLNGGAFAIKPLATRVDGPLIPAAPTDLVAALGAEDRKLYVVPSKQLVVVRMGQAAPDHGFDQELWLRLMKALG
jgi:CubicO group peptidase (beta-lactamase class C family)